MTMASSMSSTIDTVPHLLGDKLPPTLSTLLCSQCNLPLIEPRQASCGCRICGNCFSSLNESNVDTFTCKRCGYDFSLNETFKDKAVEIELKRTSFPCYHQNCPWCGSNLNYRDHINDCKFAIVVCSNPSCGVQVVRGELDKHLATCPYKPISCRYCQAKIPANKKQEHVNNDCPEYKIPCTAGCDEKIPRKELGEHLEKYCKQQKRLCRYSKYGCHYKDTLEQLVSHYRSEAGYHVGLLEKALNDGTHFDLSRGASEDIQRQLDDIERRTLNTSAELVGYRDEIHHRLNPLTDGLLKLESKLTDFQDSFQELALLVQTLQATSYNGQFIWKIPEVSRRTQEAKSGKTISLYSAPFYTSRFGYKLCLRLYLDGDGSGKGSHLSFFLTIMRGEYDALLPWPFAQMVTLMLLDQVGKKHVIQCFKPEATSSSFWRPESDMNVASGCPKFAPLSVLSNSSYVRDDTMFFKVLIETTTLNQP